MGLRSQHFSHCSGKHAAVFQNAEVKRRAHVGSQPCRVCPGYSHQSRNVRVLLRMRLPRASSSSSPYEQRHQVDGTLQMGFAPWNTWGRGCDVTRPASNHGRNLAIDPSRSGAGGQPKISQFPSVDCAGGKTKPPRRLLTRGLAALVVPVHAVFAERHVVQWFSCEDPHAGIVEPKPAGNA